MLPGGCACVGVLPSLFMLSQKGGGSPQGNAESAGANTCVSWQQMSTLKAHKAVEEHARKARPLPHAAVDARTTATPERLQKVCPSGSAFSLTNKGREAATWLRDNSQVCPTTCQRTAVDGALGSAPK